MGIPRMLGGRTQGLTKNTHLSIIDNVLKILDLDKEPESTLQRAIDYLVGEAGIADAGIIWRYEPSSGSMNAWVTAGINSNTLLPKRLFSTRGIIDRIFQFGIAELYPADKSISGKKDNSRTVSGTRIYCLDCGISAACFPLLIGKTKYGVLTFLNFQNGYKFNRSVLLFFKVIAVALTARIEKAVLIKELKEKEVSESINRYKAALIPTLAHEMRTPLISIKGYTTALLMEEAVFSPDKQREFLEIINRESDVLEGLISDYLESSVIDAGMMKINQQPVKLQRLAAKVAEEVAHRLTRHSLVVDFPPGYPLIDADPERISQVLRQLLDNAAKYSPKGGMIVLQGKIDHNKAIVSVADEGVGIAPEDLPHLFDRFFRVKSHSGNAILGTGLGLPISKAIIEAHGGNIWAESQPGQGSQFYFSLPLKSTGLKWHDERKPSLKRKY